MLGDARWLDFGHGDSRLPPVCVIDFSHCVAPDRDAFEKHGVALPSALQRAVPKRQVEYLAGRLAALKAIERLGLVATVPGIGTSREPLWQPGVLGSITHTTGMACAVAIDASSAHGVGIDVEHVVDANGREAILGQAVTARELAVLQHPLSDLSVETLLTIAFSAKESFFKGTFARVGRYFDFDAVQLTDIDPALHRLTLVQQQTLGPTLPAGRTFHIHYTMLSPATIATSFLW